MTVQTQPQATRDLARPLARCCPPGAAPGWPVRQYVAKDWAVVPHPPLDMAAFDRLIIIDGFVVLCCGLTGARSHDACVKTDLMRTFAGSRLKSGAYRHISPCWVLPAYWAWHPGTGQIIQEKQRERRPGSSPSQPRASFIPDSCCRTSSGTGLYRSLCPVGRLDTELAWRPTRGTPGDFPAGAGNHAGVIF